MKHITPLLVLCAALLAGCAAQDEIHAFSATHWDSRAHAQGFEEVFLVTEVAATGIGLKLAALRFDLDTSPIIVSWDDVDADGEVTRGDRFSFVADAFDRQRTLVAYHGDDVAWRIEFGGGAGTPV